MKHVIFFSALILLAATGARADRLHPDRHWTPAPTTQPIRMTCKSVSSCAEAVALWCGGYSRADGDGDGVPCENVCSSREEVEAIEAEIGCDN